jgi:hypothetical protein
MRFLDVKTDYAFKKVFGSAESKPILASFLNALIGFPPGREVTDLTLVDPCQRRRNWRRRSGGTISSACNAARRPRRPRTDRPREA